MQILLIRHGQTPGNLEGRYIGRTDEPLSDAGRAALAGRTLPACGALFVSPMRRCRETAAILFPDLPQTPVSGLEECDFGAFEGKNYAELNGDKDYQAWIDSGGELPFPGGESRAAFQERCCRAFAEAARTLLQEQDRIRRAAFVVHGGMIMAVLSRFGRPERGYFDWQVKNGAGFAAELTEEDGAPLLTNIAPLDDQRIVFPR